MRLHRRHFLRGAGALVALPFLESLAPRHAYAQGGPTKRFVAFYVPNGIHMRAFTPAARRVSSLAGATWCSNRSPRSPTSSLAWGR